VPKDDHFIGLANTGRGKVLRSKRRRASEGREGGGGKCLPRRLGKKAPFRSLGWGKEAEGSVAKTEGER